MKDSTITKSMFLDADTDTVWSYLTDKDKLGEWFHPAESTLDAGSDYALLGKTDDGAVVKQCWGTVIEAIPGEKLVYSFTIAPLGGEMTTVTWVLREAFGGTHLTLTHDGIAEAAGDAAFPLLLALDAGWDAHLDRLRSAIKA